MKTLKSKFIYFIILPVMVVCIAMSLVSYYTAEHLLLEQMRKSGLVYLENTGSKVVAALNRIELVIHTTALTDVFFQIEDIDREQLFVQLSDLLGKAVTSVYMGFADGKIIRSKTDPLPKTYDPRLRPWYKAALALPDGRLEGWTDPYLDMSTRRPTITFYRKMLDRSGRFSGVMGIDLDVMVSAAILEDEIVNADGGQLILVDNYAMVLLHPDVDMVGKPLENSGEILDRKVAKSIRENRDPNMQIVGKRQGMSWYAGFHRIKGTDLFIILLVPSRTVLMPLFNLMAMLIVIVLPLIIFIGMILLLMSRRISRPIIDLKDSAIRVVDDDAYQSPITIRSQDEVGQLTGAFNTMMEGLRQRDFIKDTFGRYVTREVVETLLNSPDGLKLGGEKREITIMFSDLRGFTPISEDLSPDKVIQLLNLYLGEMAKIIGRYSGTVNEFEGDGILAFFGAPINHENSPANAVACAVAMQLAMEKINRENIDMGLPRLAMGIGINTGDVIVGNIGSEERTKYGVVGYHVNLTSRIESQTLGGEILISHSTLEKVKRLVQIRSKRSIMLKGVDDVVMVYEIDGIGSPYDIYLLEKAVETIALKHPVTVSVHLMKEKKVGGRLLSGKITRFSGQVAVLLVENPIPRYSEIRIDLQVEENSKNYFLFAKIAESEETDEGYQHLIYFSYLPVQVDQFFRASGFWK